MRQRWYDARTGRFISTDPIQPAMANENLYPYCGNDPVNHTDRFGLQGADGENKRYRRIYRIT
jgi:RHS repeat-associated protein